MGASDVSHLEKYHTNILLTHAQVSRSAQMQGTAGSMPVVIMANAIALVVLYWQIVVNNALSLSITMTYGDCFIKATKQGNMVLVRKEPKG